MNESNEPLKYPESDASLINSSNFPESMSRFEVNVLTRIINNWIVGNGSIINDESGFSIYNVIPHIFMCLKNINISPILIITNRIQRWAEQITDLTTKKPLVLSEENTKISIDGFDFAMVENQNKINVPNIKWGLVILDGYECNEDDIYRNNFQMVKELNYLNISLILGKAKLEKDDFDFFKLNDEENSYINITEKNIIDSEYIEEKICLCDFSEKQRSSSYRLLLSNKTRLTQAQKTQNERLKMFFQEIIHQMQIFSVLSPKDEGKFKKLKEIIDKEREENRKILIVCENLSILKEINSTVDKIVGSYFLIDNSIRRKKLLKMTTEINSTDEYCIILTSLEYNFFEDILEYINFDSILSFDLFFNPLKYIQKIINWLKKTPNPLLMKLITSNSIEQISFNIFWKERNLKFYNQLSLEECNSILAKSADMLIYENDISNNEFIVNYSNSSDYVIFEEKHQESQNFWEDYFLKYETIQNERINELKSHEEKEAKKKKVQPELKKIKPNGKNEQTFQEEEEMEVETKKSLRNKQKKENGIEKNKRGRPKKIIEDIEDEVDTMKTRHSKKIPSDSYNKKDEENYSIWKGRMLTRLLNLLQEYGCNHWSKFEEFGRTEDELKDTAAYLIYKMNGFTKEFPKINKTFSKEIKNKSYMKIEGNISSLDYHFSKIDIPSFLEKLEITTAIGDMKPRNPNDIKLKNLKLLNDKEWTKEDNQDLLFTIYEEGLSAAKNFKYPDQKRNIEDRIRILLGIKGNLITKQSISSEDHEIILLNLQNYDFTTVEEFQDHSNLFHLDLETLQNYINLIYDYCNSETSNERKKSLQSSLKGQISKYGGKKLYERKKLFETIRKRSKLLNEYSAEDIEFLTAASFHGFLHTESSPTLQIAFSGECRETRVYQRIKQIFSEQSSKKKVVCLDNILESLPFQLDPMHMLINFGTISEKDGYSDELYIYPIGYKCYCMCISPFEKDTKIWVNAEVLDGGSKPLFKIYTEDNSISYEGNTPSEPFQLLRYDAMNNLKTFIPPFDGIEMFGFLTPYFHQIILSQLKSPLKYHRRFFKNPFILNKEWPIIGEIPKIEHKSNSIKEPTSKVKITPKSNKYPKKLFGTIVPPLVLDFSPLINSESSKSIINIIPSKELPILIERFSEWDKETIMNMIPNNRK